MPMYLPNDTGLIPHKNYRSDQCILTSCAKIPLDIKSITDLINSFFGTFLELIESREKIFCIFEKYKAPIMRTPIRVFLRKTSFYYTHLQNFNPSSKIMIPEEIKQLLREDIPYFFTSLNSQSLYYYSDVSGTISEVKEINSINFNYEKFVANPSQLMSLDRCINFLVNSCLWMVARLTCSDLNIITSKFAIKREGGLVYFESNGIFRKARYQ